MTASTNGGVRQRKGKKKNAKKEKSNKPSKSSNGNQPNSDHATSTDGSNGNSSSASESLWEIFSKHPLVHVSTIILIPYAFYRLFYYVCLQNPQVMKGLVELRPAVGLEETRQLLIVGTMSSGTVQVASDLYSMLSLEVAHEVSDSTQYFARDGTVSWFHISRFMESPSPQALLNFCQVHVPRMGFHPKMYRSTSSCSVRTQWDACWSKECVALLEQEWGCGLEGGKSDAGDEWSGSSACQTPFQRTLLQVRHPIRTVESLVRKFCVSSDDTLDNETSVHSSFLQYLSVLFEPSEDDIGDWSTLSCIEAAGWYVIKYDTAMLDAIEKGFIHDFYRVEETSPCRVAQMAGLGSFETTIYAPNHEKVSKICEGSDDAAGLVEDDLFDQIPAAHKPMQSTKHKINKGMINLELPDFMGGVHLSSKHDGDETLMKAMRDLMEQLGYDPDKVKAEEEVGEVF